MTPKLRYRRCVEYRRFHTADHRHEARRNSRHAVPNDRFSGSPAVLEGGTDVAALPGSASPLGWRYRRCEEPRPQVGWLESWVCPPAPGSRHRA